MAVLTMASLVSGLNKEVGQWFFKENHLETYEVFWSSYRSLNRVELQNRLERYIHPVIMLMVQTSSSAWLIYWLNLLGRFPVTFGSSLTKYSDDDWMSEVLFSISWTWDSQIAGKKKKKNRFNNKLTNHCSC